MVEPPKSFFWLPAQCVMLAKRSLWPQLAARGSGTALQLHCRQPLKLFQLQGVTHRMPLCGHSNSVICYTSRTLHQFHTMIPPLRAVHAVVSQLVVCQPCTTYPCEAQGLQLRRHKYRGSVSTQLSDLIGRCPEGRKGHIKRSSSSIARGVSCCPVIPRWYFSATFSLFTSVPSFRSCNTAGERWQNPGCQSWVPSCRGAPLINHCASCCIQRVVSRQRLHRPVVAAASLYRIASTMLASHNPTSRPIAVQRQCLVAFRPARIVSSEPAQQTPILQWLHCSRSSWLLQAPVVARRPLVCQAAAEIVEADSAAAPKGGIAHLRFKRGSVFKVRAASRQLGDDCTVASGHQKAVQAAEQIRNIRVNKAVSRQVLAAGYHIPASAAASVLPELQLQAACCSSLSYCSGSIAIKANGNDCTAPETERSSERCSSRLQPCKMRRVQQSLDAAVYNGKSDVSNCPHNNSQSAASALSSPFRCFLALPSISAQPQRVLAFPRSLFTVNIPSQEPRLRATTHYLSLCFSQVRRVLDVMRGRSFEDAILMMEYMPYRACEEILKALKSVSSS